MATQIVRCDAVAVTKASVLTRLSTLQSVDAAFATGVILVLAVVGWVPHLPSSLWLDETLTFWVIRDGLAQTLDRTIHYQPQPAYYVFMWFWAQLAGTSEIALRLPSLVAALAACFALARLGRELTGDRETGWIAAIVFATSWNVFRESVDARSYTLGLLVLICLVLAWLRWLEEGRWRDAWLCGVLGALLPFLHVFFVLTYPALALHAFMRRSPARCSFAQVGLVGSWLLLGALLFMPVALMLAENGGSYLFVATPSWHSLFEMFVWGPPVAGLLAGFGLAGVLGTTPKADDAPRDDAPGVPSRAGAGLLASWMFLPLLLLFAISIWTQSSVFLGRYLIPAIPAVALIYALALRAIASGPARVIAVSVIVFAALASHVRPADDFRGAAAAVNDFIAGEPSTPVLFASGLIEGQDERWLRDPVLADYLNAPVEYYPFDSRPIALPRRLAEHPMAAEIVDPILARGDRFAAVEWYGNGARALAWLVPRAHAAGYRVVRQGFGGVRVAFFRREPVAR